MPKSSRWSFPPWTCIIMLDVRPDRNKEGYLFVAIKSPDLIKS